MKTFKVRFYVDYLIDARNETDALFRTKKKFKTDLVDVLWKDLFENEVSEYRVRATK